MFYISQQIQEKLDIYYNRDTLLVRIQTDQVRTRINVNEFLL